MAGAEKQEIVRLSKEQTTRIAALEGELTTAKTESDALTKIVKVEYEAYKKSASEAKSELEKELGRVTQQLTLAKAGLIVAEGEISELKVTVNSQARTIADLQSQLEVTTM